MITGDLYKCDTSTDNVVVVGIVSETADEDGTFEGWELSVNKRTGRLLGAISATRRLGPRVHRLISAPLTPDEAKARSGGPMAETVRPGDAMIEITITRKTEVPYKETISFELSREPTEIAEPVSEYGSIKHKVAYKTTSEPREVTKYRTETRTLVSQQIEDEAKFDLLRVIAAINGMTVVQP